MTVKRVVVVPVALLPLKDDAARHSLKLIAGTRWTPTPPRDSGIGSDEPGGEHGYVKISCEDFPRPAMNLKWASDALDRLVEKANVCLLSSRFLKVVSCTSAFTEIYQYSVGHPGRHPVYFFKGSKGEEGRTPPRSPRETDHNS